MDMIQYLLDITGYFWLMFSGRDGSLFFFSFLCHMTLLSMKLERHKTKFRGEIWLKCTLLNFGLPCGDNTCDNTCRLWAQEGIKGCFVV